MFWVVELMLLDCCKGVFCGVGRWLLRCDYAVTKVLKGVFFNIQLQECSGWLLKYCYASTKDFSLLAQVKRVEAHISIHQC